ncbi:MAG: TIM barrel protein [Verrucomicrobiota bacterium]|nr:TIM barrel protein [Verrucomicrobiota bacterium]
MRLGGQLFEHAPTPEGWTHKIKQLGYRAAYSPIHPGSTAEEKKAYVEAAKAADIIISELGTWSNPLSDDAQDAQNAINGCIAGLALCEEAGITCCVNIAGSKGKVWCGPDARNYTQETFDQIVESTRQIIDAVKPTRTFYTLEMMPWAYPDSAESYLDLMKAIDRPAFGVHFDPVNILNSPEKLYKNGAVIRDFVDRLGHKIKSCHAKDITINENSFAVEMREVGPGLGVLDYETFLTCVDKLSPDMPLMLEHLEKPEQYDAAAAHIRSTATRLGISKI